MTVNRALCARSFNSEKLVMFDSTRTGIRPLALLAGLATALLVLPPAFAQSEAVSQPAQQIGLGLALLGGFVQLILGVALAVTSIAIGIRILSRVLPEVNVTDALSKRNSAVGVMTAGVVIAYTKVISTGITQMGHSISVAPSIGSFIGGAVNVAVGIALASIGVTWAFKALTRVTPNLAVAQELNGGNVAVGLFVAGVLYGISEMIAAAVSGIGQALASALSRLI
jgi:uncharacterized membrane protein YjfL (UPF0719 family)